MSLETIDEVHWQQRCEADGEFQLASRFWDGGVRLQVGEQTLQLYLDRGRHCPENRHPQGVIEFTGDNAVWQKVLAATPPPFHNDMLANMSVGGGLSRTGEPVVFAQYYAAAMRAVELLRPRASPGEILAHDLKPEGTMDAPVGRYIHLQLGGYNHRIYYEEAGQGIPLLLQHTAGCHSSQWRHLFECPEITERFRLIAYDLPCHGKSLPPPDKSWWENPYQLEGEFLRSIPLRLSAALNLDRPVFMGCSVGGLLALDLARRHPAQFRAVISLEGALKIDGNTSEMSELYHPQVNNEYKARVMDGLMASGSPKAYRKETSFVYASGWPPVFLGDLHYYMSEYDLTDLAAEIDTSEVAVHILSGEYDYSGSTEKGRAAHEAIKGSTWQEMKGVGHFPMSENPAAFKEYLLPILDQIVPE